MSDVVHNKREGTQGGFSLVELLVALSIFAIIATASTAALLTLIDINAKAQALHNATTNLSFALDSITREIRMGYRYYCFNSTSNEFQDLPSVGGGDLGSPHDCTNGKDGIAFYREKDGKHFGYRLNTSNDGIKKIQQKIETGAWEDITSMNEVVITKFEITIENSATYIHNGDMRQPIVNLHVSGYVNNGLETNTDFDVQTHIVQRRLDII